MELKSMGKKIILGAACVLATSPMIANAGPSVTFGPQDEGVLQIDYKAQFQVATRDTGSGPDNTDNTATANFRRNRLAFMGAWSDMYSIYVQTEFVEDVNLGPLTVNDEAARSTDFSLIDAQLRFKFNDALQLRIGKFKHNLTREGLEDCFQPLTLDRSLFMQTPFVATRDRGLALWGNLVNDKLQYRLDIMEGRESGDDAPESSFRYTARVHVSLLDPENGYGYRGTYLGKKKVLTLGASYQTEPDIVYADTVAQTGASAYAAWSADLFLEYPMGNAGTATLSAAYLDVDVDDAYQGANPDPHAIGLNGEKNGGYIKAGYMLANTPLQIFFRSEGYSFANLDGIYDQELDFMGAGLNYYIRNQDLKLTLEYSNTDFKEETASIKDFSTIILQLQLML